jgi:hypothetical protein
MAPNFSVFYTILVHFKGFEVFFVYFALQGRLTGLFWRIWGSFPSFHGLIKPSKWLNAHQTAIAKPTSEVRRAYFQLL